jgi:glycosyltransferase involved in cell wall biosynthesis
MKNYLLESSNSYSNVFRGINHFFNSSSDVSMVNCAHPILQKIIDISKHIVKPKMYSGSITMMPNFYTGLAKMNILWIHDALYFEEHFVYGCKSDVYYNFKKHLISISRNAKYIITPTQYSKNKLITYLNCSEDKILVFPYQISKELYLSNFNSKDFHLKTNKDNREVFKILFIGSAHYRKNLKQVLLTFKKFNQDVCRNSKLYVVSEPRKNILSTFDLYDEINKTPNVSLLDNISNNEIIKLVSTCDVLLNPTLEEGFGLPNIESQFIGTPVISSNISCIPEVLEDSAILVNPLSTDDQISALLKIKNDETFRNNLIKLGKKNTIKYNNLPKYQELLDLLYE